LGQIRKKSEAIKGRRQRTIEISKEKDKEDEFKVKEVEI